MSVIMGSNSRTPWLGAIAALFVIWSLYATMHSSRGKHAVASIVKGDTPELVETSPIVEAANIVGDRPLIQYAYADGKTDNARDNLKFFLAHGLHDAADFVFILNGETTARILIPNKPNIRIVQRPNDCYDMGAHAEVLQAEDNYKRYKRFILMNASVRGPMLPHWTKECWTDMFLGRLSEEVKLVGLTANCKPFFHVQSMVLATDIIGIETLLHPSKELLEKYEADPPPNLRPNDPLPWQAPGINGCFHSWESAVVAEISTTRLLQTAGFKVDVMMSAFHSMNDYPAECDPESGDLLWENEYFGISVHPFETVFMKANRNITPLTMDRHTEWINKSKYSSYRYCKVPSIPSYKI